MTLLDAKDAMRRDMRAKLAAMTPANIAAKSTRIVQVLTRDAAWLPPKATVALFGGIHGEPDLLPLIPWLLERHATPVLFGFHDGVLLPRSVEASTVLERGIFGVWMPPENCPVVPYAQLDVILTPGLAFGRDCMRLGRGRGHFDRLFARPEVKARRIGVCWECQRVAAVPTERHDAPMDAVITEG